MLRTSDCNPHFFDYPCLSIYLQALGCAFVVVINGCGHPYRMMASTVQARDMPNWVFYLPGRLTTALLGVATVGLLYVVARQMYSKATNGRPSHGLVHCYSTGSRC
ncbi:MAG: hypothetical protein H5T64_11940 [Chloroflexi bacterium]|nr:hypothetical protein [Chloroflexota bacterium]